MGPTLLYILNAGLLKRMFIKWGSWNENVKMDKWKYKERPWNIGIWNEEIPIKIETTIDKRERERVMVWLCAKRAINS